MIATQDYGWSQLAARAGLRWPDATGWAMRQAAEAGFESWEPFLRGPEDAERVGRLARDHGLAMRSAFVADALHEEVAAAEARPRMAATARAAGRFGCKAIMVYPEPSPRGRKTDAELAIQARHVEALAREVGDAALLYHAEEAEMAEGAREFEHVLAHTDAALVRLCLDPDAAWRGGGTSADALLALAERHAGRIDALHLRQSQDGVWAETVGAGDLPLERLAALLRDRQPFLVIEHAYEAGTPETLGPVEAHRRSLAFVQAAFAA